MNIISYLTFNGNCREAMQFYQQCLGGQLIFQTIGESPLSEKMPKKIKEYILHSTLTNDTLIIMGSDMVDDSGGLIKGNAVSLMLSCNSAEEIYACFKALSSGGKAARPLKDTFWGDISGDLTDKYGNHWLLHYRRND